MQDLVAYIMQSGCHGNFVHQELELHHEEVRTWLQACCKSQGISVINGLLVSLCSQVGQLSLEMKPIGEIN